MAFLGVYEEFGMEEAGLEVVVSCEGGYPFHYTSRTYGFP